MTPLPDQSTIPRDDGVKLWHDDVRRPPNDSWTWARTNAEAVAVLTSREVYVASLDHDLGAHEANPDDAEACFIAGTSPDGSGYDLVCWMVETGHVPAHVTIHSWNPPGAQRMARKFADHGYVCVVRPYELPREVG